MLKFINLKELDVSDVATPTIDSNVNIVNDDALLEFFTHIKVELVKRFFRFYMNG